MPGSALDFLLQNLPGAAGAVDQATRPERLLDGPLPSPVLNVAMNLARASLPGGGAQRLQALRFAEEAQKGVGEAAMGVAYPQGVNVPSAALLGPAAFLPGVPGTPLGGFDPIQGIQRAGGWASGPIPQQGPPLPDSIPGTTGAWTLNPDANPLERLGYAIERTRGAEHYAPEQVPGLKGLGELAAQPTSYVGFGLPERLAAQVSSPLLRSILGAAGATEHAFTAIPGGVLGKAWEGAKALPGVGPALETSQHAVAAQAQDRVTTLLAALGRGAEQFPQLQGTSGWRLLAAREGQVALDDARAAIAAGGLDARTLRSWGNQANQDKELGRAAVGLVRPFTPAVTEPIPLAQTRTALEAKAGVSAADTDTLLQEALPLIPDVLDRPKPPDYYTIADVGKGLRAAQDARLAAQGAGATVDEATLEAATKAAQMAYLQERYGDILPATLGRGAVGNEAAVAARIARQGEGAAAGAGERTAPGAAAPSGVPADDLEATVQALMRQHKLPEAQARLIATQGTPIEHVGVTPAEAPPVPPEAAAPSTGGIPMGRARIDPTKFQEGLDAGLTRNEAMDRARVSIDMGEPGAAVPPEGTASPLPEAGPPPAAAEALYHTTFHPWDRGPLRPNPPGKYSEGPIVWLQRGEPWVNDAGGDVLRIDPTKLDPALLGESPRFGYPTYRGEIPPEAITVMPRAGEPAPPPGTPGEALAGAETVAPSGAPAGTAPAAAPGAEPTLGEQLAQHADLTDQILRMNTTPGSADFGAKVRQQAPDLVTRYDDQLAKAKALQAEVGGAPSLRQLAEHADPAVAQRAKDILGATGGGDPLTEHTDAVINQMWGKQYLDSLNIRFSDPGLMRKGYNEIMQVWRQQALFAPAFILRNQIDASARMLIYAGNLGIDHPLNPFTAKDPDSYWQIFRQAWRDSAPEAAPRLQPNLGVNDAIRAELTAAPTPADVVTGMAQREVEKGRGLERLSGTGLGRLGGAAAGAAVGAPAGPAGMALGAGLGFVAAPWMGRATRAFRNLYTAQEQIMRSTGYNHAYRAAVPRAQATLEDALKATLGESAPGVIRAVDDRAGLLSPKDFSDALDAANVAGEARIGAEAAFGAYRGTLEDAGRQFSHKLFINYQNTTNADEWMRQFFGFHVFSTRSLPFYAETLATHPGLLSAVEDFKAAKEQQAKGGGYSKNRRMVYAVELPSDQEFLTAAFGHAGHIFIDPTGYVSLVQGAIQATQDSPDARGTSVVGTILNQLQRVGLSPTPPLQVGLEIAGAYGGQQPQSLLRTEPLVERGTQALTGQFSEAPWKTLQRQRIGPFADRAPNDPAMTARLMLRQMALEQDRAYADAHPTDPISPRFRQAMVTGAGDPLYDAAVRRLGQQGFLEAGATYAGAPLRFRSNTETAIDQVGAALPEVNAQGGSRPLEPVIPNPGVLPGTPLETAHLHAQRLAQIAAGGRPEAAANNAAFARNVGEAGGSTQPSAMHAMQQAVWADYQHADPARKQALLNDPATRPFVLEFMAKGIKTPMQPVGR